MSETAGLPPIDPPMLRFVVLRHEEIAEPHYDLMYETSAGSELATWRCDRWPIVVPTPLVRLSDHRRAYLEYEGPISGGRGSVRRVSSGSMRLLQLEAGGVELMLQSSAEISQLLIRQIINSWIATPI